jgi:amino acid adenylation domain-containing protein
LEYDSGLFAGNTISRMLDRFGILLQAIVDDPARSLCELPILTANERHLLVVEWNRTDRKYDRAGCAHELFEAQVCRTPEAPAIVWRDSQMTFMELNAQANCLAHYLRSLKISAESLVGIALDRSPAMIVAMLGVLKAGAGYVPLEPSMPPERLAFVAADAQMRLLLSDTQWTPSLASMRVPVLSVEGDLTRLGMDSSNPPAAARPHNVAYVIYTSGSTGQPKGVIVEHRGLSNYLLWCLETYPTAGRVGAPLYSSWAFDLAVTSLLVPLLCGRALVLVPEKGGGRQVLETLTEHPDFCFVKGTPTHMTLMNEFLCRDPAALKPRALILGGEQLLAEQIAPWRQQAPETAIFNEYGPTETVVGSCIYRVTERTPRAGAIPIGQPIANTQVYVLDAQGQPSPIGVWGELYIAGAGVARGYLNLPDLTARKFVRNPFSGDPEARMYRTGDRVRWRSDGDLEFLGRLDHQVKLNGYRIELGEIEAVLSQHPQIGQAAVVLRQDGPEGRHLAAYFVAIESANPPTKADIATWLTSKLPHYMVPSYLIPLAALPLNSNGKIDRRRLPVPESEGPGRNQTAVSVNDISIETGLTELWQEVLGVESVGLNDDFFELGGNSIVALRLFGEIERRFQRRLPLALLYRHATVARLADCLKRQVDENASVSIVELHPGNSEMRRLFALPTMAGELMAIRKLVLHLGDETPVFGLQPSLTDGVPVEFEKFESTAARFVEGLRLFQPQGPYALIGYSYGGMLAYEMARQLFEQGDCVDLLAVLDVGPGDEMRSSPPVARLIRSIFNFCRRQSLRLHRAAGRFGRRMASAVFDRELNIEIRRPPRPRLPTQNPGLLEALFKGVSDYAPIPFPGIVTLFTAKHRPLLSGASRDLGWARYALGGVEVHEIAGDHDGILDEPNVRVLAGELKECLGRLSQPNS